MSYVRGYVLCDSVYTTVLYSPLGKLADRAIYFTFRNFFFFLLGAKLSHYLLDRFHDLFTKWKVFA